MLRPMHRFFKSEMIMLKPTQNFSQAVGLFLLALTVTSGCGAESTPENPAHVEESHEADTASTHDVHQAVRLTAAEIKEFEIEVREAGPGIMHLEKTFPGEIHVNEDRYAHVVPRVPGIVRSVRKSLGDQVRAGEVMAVLESRELADAKASYLAALERAELARSNFEREERLYEKEISSEQEYLEARQALAEARIELRSGRQKLRALGFSDSYIQGLPDEDDASLIQYPLFAPFTGTVVEKHIVQGEALDADADAFEVADLSTVWVDLSIYQKDMGLIEEGQTVVIASGAHRERGEISYVRPIVGEETRTALARVVVPNPHGAWKPGMFVNGRISVDATEVPVVVPKSAIQNVDGETVVFVRTPEGFAPQPVVLADENSEQVAIASGLSPGDEYVASGGFALKSQLQKGEMDAGHAH